ncbi:MAG: caspase domain-containing protein [Bacteroidota bacterium]
MKKILLFICLLLSIGLYSQEKRLALVIGNSAYEHGGVLKNPVNDANLMATTLEDLGFAVIKKTNATKREMDASILDYWRKLKDYDVALFYYAGHGVQVDGVNYLIPIDAGLEDKLSLKIEAVNVGEIVSQYADYPNNINIVILDACRDNPYRTWVRSGSLGFAAMPAPSGTLIAFATAPGATASDGSGKNGLYTEKLAQQMRMPQRIEDVFINTRNEVRHASGGKQNPQEWSQLTGQFMFVDPLISYADKPQLGEPQLIFKYGTIELTTELSGVLYLDGAFLSQISQNTVVPINQVIAGNHKLNISGKENWSARIEVRENQSTRIIAKSSILENREKTTSQRLTLTQSKYSTSVYMDGEKLNNKEIKDILRQSNSSALRTYKNGLSYRGLGVGGAVFGGAVVVSGFVLTIATSEVAALLVSGLGGALGLAALGTVKQGTTAKARGINIYNSTKTGLVGLYIGPTHNGIGIACTF